MMNSESMKSYMKWNKIKIRKENVHYVEAILNERCAFYSGGYGLKKIFNRRIIRYFINNITII